MDDILSRILNNQLISLTLNKVGRKSKQVRQRQHNNHHAPQQNTEDKLKDDVVAIGVDLIGHTESYDIDIYNTSTTLLQNVDSITSLEPNSASVSSNQHSSILSDQHNAANNTSSAPFNFGYSTIYRSLVSALSINKSLTYLSLGHNSLDSNAIQLLCEVLVNNTTLTHLCLPLNKIDLDGYKTIAHTFKHNTTLTYLDLSGNSMLDDGALYIADMIQHNKALVTLDLTWCTIYVSGARAIAKALKYNRTLKYLNISKNFVLHEGCTVLADTLQHNRVLTKLDLSNNLLYSDGAKALSLGLCNQLTTQNIITATQSFLSRQSSSNSNSGTASLQCNALTELNLMNNEIGNTGLKYLTAALRTNNVLQTLILNENLISFDGAAHLSSVLKRAISPLHAPNITHLYLSDNNLGVKGADALARALLTNKTLTKLHIGANAIEPPGIKALCKGLLHNTTLTELNLSWNRFGLDGVKYLATMLIQNSTLRELYLSHNKIGDDGCEMLANALALNKGLHLIDINGNRIKSKGIEILAQLLPQNYTLLTVQYDQTTGQQHAHNAPAQQGNVAPHAGDNVGVAPPAAAAAALGGLAAAQNFAAVAPAAPAADNNVVADNDAGDDVGIDINNDIDNMNAAINNLHVNVPTVIWSPAADITIHNVLTRNARLAIKRNKLAVLMGFHQRVGRDSALQQAFKTSAIGDMSIMHEIFSYVYTDTNEPALHKQAKHETDQQAMIRLNGTAYNYIYSRNNATSDMQQRHNRHA